LRIVIITWEFPPRVIGDVAYHIDRIAQTLVHNGIDVFVVTYHNQLHGLEIRKDGVNVYRVKNPVESQFNILTWDLTLASELEKAVSDIYYSTGKTIDLIDAHEWLSVVPSTVLNRALKIPFIYSVNSLEEHRSNYGEAPLNIAIKNLERLGTQQASKIIVKSEWMKSEIERLHKTPAEKIISIPSSSINWSAEIREVYRRMD